MGQNGESEWGAILFGGLVFIGICILIGLAIRGPKTYGCNFETGACEANKGEAYRKNCAAACKIQYACQAGTCAPSATGTFASADECKLQCSS